MSIVVSFHGFTPSPRYDDRPWTNVRIEESVLLDPAIWTTIDTIAITPDVDPANPSSRSFTTENGTAPDLFYRVTFLDDFAGETEPSEPIQNTALSGPFVSRSELVRILRINAPTEAQTEAMDRVLIAAADEIRAEIDLRTDDLTSSQLAICATVNLDRAADLWRHTESAPGILGILDENVPTTPGRYSWARYAARLSVVKDQWGIA